MQQSNKIFATIAIAFALLFGGASVSFAESAGMPEFNGQFVVKTPDGLTSLERETSQQQRSYLSASFVFSVPDSHSRVQLKSGHNLVFYVKANQAEDPQATIKLRAMSPGKTDRTYVYAKENAFTRAKSEAATIPYSAEKKGSEYFEIRLPSDLAPGEYGWSRLGATEMYLFAVTE